MKPVKKMYMRNSLKPIESVDNIDTAISTTAIADDSRISSTTWSSCELDFL